MTRDQNENKHSALLKILLFLNAPFLLLLALSNLAPYADPVKWWFIALSGFFFIFLFVLALSSLLFWFFVKRKYALWPLLAIILSIPNLTKTIPLHFTSGINKEKNPNDLRVITWNVGLLNYSAPDNETAIALNTVIFDKLKALQPDVVCLQEIFTAVYPDSVYNFIDHISEVTGMRYHFFSRDFPKFDGKFYSGTVIFSKYPIVDSSKHNYSSGLSNSIIRTGILFGKDTIDIISTKLENIIFGRDREQLHEKLSKIGELKYSYSDQKNQVHTTDEVINASKRPLIFTGDFNDVPTTYTYQKIKGNMKDAWLEKGCGTGGTFKSRFILRIDNIFYNKYFTATGIEHIVTNSSDHDGIVADFRLNK